MDNLTEKIINKIKENEVKPVPRWHFVIKRIFLWVPGIICTLIGGISVYAIMYGTSHNGWEFRRFTHQSNYEFLVDTLQYIWILSFVLFYIFTINLIRITKDGYKYKISSILLISFLTSVIIGTSVFILINTSTMKYSFGFEGQIKNEQRLHWSFPEKGRVLGLITDIKENNYIIVKDQEGNEWNLNIEQIPADIKNNIEEGDIIRVLGEITEKNNFTACAIFPWDFENELEIRNKPSKKEFRKNVIRKGEKERIIDQCKKFDLFNKSEIKIHL